MGLDMYVTTAPAELVGDEQISFPMLWVEDAEGNAKKALGVDSEFAYWRKFNALHGWMESLYKAKGGTEQFNCEDVRLMPEDLDKLERDAKLGIEGRGGFFWGSVHEWNKDDEECVLSFVADARNAINEGKAVIYSSWW